MELHAGQTRLLYGRGNLIEARVDEDPYLFEPRRQMWRNRGDSQTYLSPMMR